MNTRQSNPTISARLLFSLLTALWIMPSSAGAQQPTARIGEAVARDVREMYDRGIQYLATTQAEAGDWSKASVDAGPGGTGLCLMALLASGEDPNFGIYSNHVRRALRSIISQQNAETGILGSSMYHHGFGMLALAEAYGAVDDRSLWTGSELNRRSIGQALELAVRGAITSQKRNAFGGWRYAPSSTDADTSVSGAVLVGLLAARNAGIEVPDEVIDRAIAYFVSMTSPAGHVGYSGGFGGFDESLARISIGSLVYSLARRKDLPQFVATLNFLTNRLESSTAHWEEYTRYYQSQALFQGDPIAWAKWNTLLIRRLKAKQNEDGSFRSDYGPAFGTSMSLLALALNYRFLPIYER